MSILKVNDIRRATTGSSALVFNDPVIITSGTISASVLVGSLPGAVSIGDGTIGKEKLTLDARDWVNVLNKPSGLISSSGQFALAISGSSLALGDITSSGTIKTTGLFSGSGVYLYDIPNSALNNSTITINGVLVPLGGSRTIVTSEVSESVNLYYTDARVKAKLNAEGIVSSSGQINYQAMVGQPSVNTLGSDGNASFTVTAGIFVTGSTGIDITTDAPNAKITIKTVGGTVSSSTQVKSNLPADTVSSSTQVKNFLPTDTVSSSVQTKAFLPGGTVSASSQYPGWVTASSQIDYNSITNKLSGVVSSSNQVKPLLPDGTISSSIQFNTVTTPFTGSFTGSLTGQVTGSILANNNVVSSSAQTKAFLPDGTVSASAQYPGWVTASSQIDVRDTTGIATIATTGSNTFNGNQTISGSVTLTGNLNVFGTSSILYTTSSQLNVGTNKITIGTDQTLRFGGLSIIDSGSAGSSGSLYWDSLNDRWLYEDVFGGVYSSAILIAGPKNTGTIGNERGLVTGRIPVASGDDHIDTAAASSSIRVDFPSRLTHVEAGLYITGGLTVQGNISGNLVVPTDTVSSSVQIKTFLPGGTVSASAQYPGWVTSSSQIDYNSITNKLSAVVSSSTQVQSLLPGGTVSASAQYPGWVTASSQIDYNSITNKLSDVVSSSTQIQPLLPAGTVSSSGQVTATSTTGFTSGVEQILKDNNVHSASFLGTATTNNLSEGFTNLYYTDARVKTKLNAEAVHSGSSLGTATTTNLTEGTNLYFTTPRVISSLPTNTVSSSNQVSNFLPAGTLSASSQVNLSQAFDTASRALTASYALVTQGTTATTTDGLPQGVSNLYYSDSLVKTKLNTDNVHSASFLGTATTTNLTEGINLYFTNGRVVNALPAGTVSSSTQVSVLIPAGTVSSSTQVDYNNIQNKLSGVVSSSSQVQPLLPGGTVSSSTQYPGWVTSSTQIFPFTGSALISGALRISNRLDFDVAATFANSSNITASVGANATRVQLGSVSNTGVQIIIGTTPYWEFNTAGGLVPTYTIQDIGSNGVPIRTLWVSNISSSTPIQSASFAATAKFVLPSGLPSGTVSSSAQYPGWVTASSQIDYNSITNKLSGVVSSSTQVQPLLPDGTVSSSGQVDYNSITNKLSGVYSSSAQAVAAIDGQTIAPSIINATGAISGASIQTSGNGIILGNVGIGTLSPNAKLDVRDGKIIAGTISSTGGPSILEGYYSNGAITVFGSEYSNGGPMLGYAVRPASSSADAFISATGIAISRGAYIIAGDNHKFFTGGSQTVAENGAVTMIEQMRLTSTGLGIGITVPTTKLHVNGAISGSSLEISGRTDIAQVREKLNTKTGATGTVTHDYSTGAIFYHSSISANFTINLTNVPTDNDKTIAITVILNQGGTGYYPSAFQIDGSAQTLRWANNETPTPSANKVDVATFSVIRTGGSWIVLGNYTPFA